MYKIHTHCTVKECEVFSPKKKKSVIFVVGGVLIFTQKAASSFIHKRQRCHLISSSTLDTLFSPSTDIIIIVVICVKINSHCAKILMIHFCSFRVDLILIEARVAE